MVLTGTPGLESLTKETLYHEITANRGRQPVNDQNAEDKYNVLEKYGQDLTQIARDQKLDPVIGRDNEIRRVIQAYLVKYEIENEENFVEEEGVLFRFHRR